MTIIIIDHLSGNLVWYVIHQILLHRQPFLLPEGSHLVHRNQNWRQCSRSENFCNTKVRSEKERQLKDYHQVRFEVVSCLNELVA